MTDRVLLGRRGSDWGLWVSKPGQDVKTASGSNLLFDSNDAGYMNVIYSNTVNFTVNYIGELSTLTDHPNRRHYYNTGQTSGWFNYGQTLAEVPFAYYGSIEGAANTQIKPYGPTYLVGMRELKEGISYWRVMQPFTLEVQNSRCRISIVPHGRYALPDVGSSYNETTTISLMVFSV